MVGAQHAASPRARPETPAAASRAAGVQAAEPLARRLGLATVPQDRLLRVARAAVVQQRPASSRQAPKRRRAPQARGRVGRGTLVGQLGARDRAGGDRYRARRLVAGERRAHGRPQQPSAPNRRGAGRVMAARRRGRRRQGGEVGDDAVQDLVAELRPPAGPPRRLAAPSRQAAWAAVQSPAGSARSAVARPEIEQQRLRDLLAQARLLGAQAEPPGTEPAADAVAVAVVADRRARRSPRRAPPPAGRCRAATAPAAATGAPAAAPKPASPTAKVGRRSDDRRRRRPASPARPCSAPAVRPRPPGRARRRSAAGARRREPSGRRSTRPRGRPGPSIGRRRPTAAPVAGGAAACVEQRPEPVRAAGRRRRRHPVALEQRLADGDREPVGGTGRRRPRRAPATGPRCRRAISCDAVVRHHPGLLVLDDVAVEHPVAGIVGDEGDLGPVLGAEQDGVGPVRRHAAPAHAAP